MKQVIRKRFVIAGFAMLVLPSALLAQQADKKEDKGNVQTIIITRTGDEKGKMTIEVDGNKVKVNGKDVKDQKDVNVHVTTTQGRNFYRINPGGSNAWSLNGDNFSLFHEDENRAMLGVNTENHAKGAEVLSITEGSAAEKSGLKKGDIITKVGDKNVKDADDLTAAIRSHKPGEKVTVHYLRDGKEQKATAELGKWKGIRMESVPMPRIEGLMDQWKNIEPVEVPGVPRAQFFYSGRPKLGLSIEDTEDGNGVKILEVEEESNAAKAGLQENDIILSIDDKKINGTEDVMRIIRADKEKNNFTFKVQRGGKTQNIEVKFPKKLKKADL